MPEVRENVKRFYEFSGTIFKTSWQARRVYVIGIKSVVRGQGRADAAG
jgi:hypothetical protein